MLIVSVPLIVRHPFNIVASYLRMQMKDGDRGIFAQPHYVADSHFDPALVARAQADRRPVARIGYQLAAMTATMRRYAATDLRRWVDRGVGYARTLPAKSA